MTRNTSEVDVHHLGRFAPLGSRHNVNHWGDGAKQPRISHAGLKRFYYFLTTDERIGDLMREQLTADATYAEVKRTDPRMPDNRGEYASASFGTDWAAYCINWLTEYERTLDTKWLDKIKAGMDTQLALAGAPGQLLGAGPYDPADRQVHAARRRWPGRRWWRRRPHRLRSALWDCRSHGRDGTRRRSSQILGSLAQLCRRQAGQPLAYAAYVLKDPQIGARVWQGLTGPSRGGRGMGC